MHSQIIFLTITSNLLCWIGIYYPLLEKYIREVREELKQKKISEHNTAEREKTKQILIDVKDKICEWLSKLSLKKILECCQFSQKETEFY